MKKTIKKTIAVICIFATMFSIAIVSTGALTRRLYGDVNNDGVISQADVELIQKNITGIVEFDTYQKIAADVDASGQVTISDAILIQKLLSGIITGFPTGDFFVY